MAKFEVGAPLPKSLGACADLLKRTMTIRLAMEKETKAVKARENQIRDHIIASVDVKSSTGAMGRRYQARVVREEVQVVEDWDAFYEYILDEEALHLLGKSPAQKALKELAEAGHKVPGVGRMWAKKLSLTKI